MRPILKGATDQSTVLRFIDSADGTPETGVTDATDGLALWYRREGGLKVAITPASLAALDTAHTDGGVEHISDGYVRIDVPDAAFASGADGVLIGGSATGMVAIGAYHPLEAIDRQDAVRAGLTALPNAAADAAGGLPTSDAGGLDLDALNTAAVRLTAARAQVLDDWINAGRLDVILDTIAADVVNLDGAAMRGTDGANTTTPPSAAAIADAVLDEALAGHTTAGSLGKAVADTETDVNTLLTRITATLFSGITSLAEWLGLIAGKQTGNATALTEIRATGAGSGTFDPTTDSNEALRDHIGDGTNLTEAGGTGDQFTAQPWNPAWDAEVESEVLDALDTAIGTPTAGSPLEILDDLAALLPATTIAAAGDAMNASEIAGSADAATRLAESAKAIATGTVVADGANTADTFEIALGTPDDKVLGRVLFFVSGTLRYQAGVITDYNATSGFVTVETGSFTTTPTAGDTFAIN